MKPPLDPLGLNRRAFIRRAGQLALAGPALPWAINLAAFGDAAAQTATDYKALVCVFLLGGNDHANTLVAYDEASYATYHRIRGGGPGEQASELALARADLAGTVLRPRQPLSGGRVFALHPSMRGLADLFNAGRAAVQLNVGPLVVPTTRRQFASKSVPLPPKLFSHNDQVSVWQSSQPEGSTVGWGGRLGDLALSANGDSLFTCISVSGNTVFLTGQSAMQYQIATSGAIPINAMANDVFGAGQAVKDALRTIVSRPRTDALENAYNQVTARSIAAESKVNAALDRATVNTAFPGNPLASQLRLVARLIAARASLGVKRQVFFVSLGGFDHHDLLMARHPQLLEQVSTALTAFHGATVELGLADKVTAFTASDFGRTLTFNFGGSDHGWGSHHLVVGDAVRGASYYGNEPGLSVTDGDSPADQGHAGQGRLIPTTSVDPFAATLARWFGVPDGVLADILPNLRNFGTAAGRPDYPTDLGFMSL